MRRGSPVKAAATSRGTARQSDDMTMMLVSREGVT
jgi:hypothetical protein